MSDGRPSPSPEHRSLPRNGKNGAERVADLGAPEADELSLHDLIQVVRRNIWLILVIVLVTVGAVAFLVLRETPTYRAGAVIRLQDARSALTGGLDQQPVEPIIGLRARLIDPLASHLEVMRSRGVLGTVVDNEGLRLLSETARFSRGELNDVHVAPDAPIDTLAVEFLDERVIARHAGGETTAPYGAPVEFPGGRFTVPARPEEGEAVLVVDDRQRVIDRLSENLRANPREATDVFDVEYTADHPVFAQQVANAVVQEFRHQNVQAARQQSVRRRVFVEEQLSATDSMLSQAQRTLSDFRRREQVFSSREWFAAQQSGLMSLDLRRAERGADREMYDSLLEGIRDAELGQLSQRLQAVAASPEISANPIVTGLYEQLAALEFDRDSLVSGPWARSASHPDVQRVELQLAAVRDRLETAVRSHLSSLDARIEALDALRDQTVSEMGSLPETEAEESRLVLQVETIRRMADLLREEHQRARIAEAVEEGEVQIVDLASVPLDPVGARRPLKLLIGLMLGLMLGVGAAFLRENLDTAIRQREELEDVLRVPGLGVVPRIGATRSRTPWVALPRPQMDRLRSAASVKALLSEAFPRTLRNGRNGKNGTGTHKRKRNMPVADGRSAAAEAYRTVRTGLLFSEALHSIRTLLITSPAPAEGKTTTAANLAITFAEQGKRVLLVDADLRRPRLHDVFGIPRDPGLTQLILGQSPLPTIVRETEYGLHVLPAGLLPPNPAELLGGTRMREVLAQLGEAYEFVILDAAPLLLAADAAVLATQVDGSLLVVRAGKTGREDAAQALHQLASVDARVVGAVLNDPDGSLAHSRGYYRYAYSYHGYYNSDD